MAKQRTNKKAAHRERVEMLRPALEKHGVFAPASEAPAKVEQPGFDASAAYGEGQAAFADGLDLSANPHELSHSPFSRLAWNDGWYAARRKAQQDNEQGNVTVPVPRISGGHDRRP